ncbi:MAG TPA: EamA family transporter [Pyrinomonadaceae bacterium]|nr:EamA family transporter [Pyrinomonadaceae bacterium]
MRNREKWGAYGAWASVCFFWGTTYLAIRVGLETIPPMLLAGIRFLIAGVVLFLLMRCQQNVRLPRGREWFELAVVGLMLLGVGNGLVVLAEQWIPSGMAALLVATSPFWIVGLERMQKGGERANASAIVGMLIGFAGLALLVAPHLFGASLNKYYVFGLVAIQIGCFSWSAGSVYAKRRPTGVAPLMSAAVQMLYAGAALTLIGTLGGEWGEMRLSARSLGALAYLIVFGSIVAYSSYTYAMQKLPLSLVTTYSYINPVIAVLLGWAILGEPLGWRVAVATMVILGGVALVKASPKELLRLLRRPGRESREENQPSPVEREPAPVRETYKQA